MKTSLTGASGVALLAALVGASPAWGQSAQTPQPAPAVDQVPGPAPATTPGDKVIITGQLIAGASEDAPAPVEVFDLEALKEQGSPTAMEFLRQLNISSESSGNSDASIAGAAAGFANVNLRGLGTGRTMVLLNGKRFQSGDGGFGADINTIPTFAVGRIDVLKDGASVTYGAGAVGGVINYITRKLDGLELQGSWKTYDKSAGEGEVSALYGRKFDAGDFLIGASYGWQNELRLSERDFANRPYTDLPGAYLGTDSSPSNWTLYNLTGAGSTVSTIRDYTRAQCQASGGEIFSVLNTASTSQDCAIKYTPMYNFLEKETYTRGYLETNYDLDSSMRFHFQLEYAKTDDPHTRAPPELADGLKRATETRPVGSSLGAYTVPYNIQVYDANGNPTTTAINPFANEFYNRAIANGFISSATARGDLASSSQWRPAMAGPNVGYGDGRRYEWTQRERWGGSIGLKGEFTDGGLLHLGNFLPEGTTYELSGTYNLYSFLQSRPGVLNSRLENALHGYGGPDCKAVDRVATVIQRIPDRTEFPATAAGTTAYNAAVLAARIAYDRTVGIQSDTAPGTNGCQYFNPFASAWQTNLYTGAANAPYGGAAFQNTPEMLRWIQSDRVFDQRSEALTIDYTLTGEVPGFELPGGKIGWAGGVQWRQTELRNIPIGTADDVTSMAQRCTWGDQNLPANFVGQDQCAAISGPYYDSGLGRLVPSYFDRQWISYYGELQIPVLDNLNFQVAARREDYQTITGDIWKIAGKYDVLPWLSFRGSYSTNFQVPPDSIKNTEPQVSGVYFSSLLRTVPTTVRTLSGIQPEDDKGSNLGVIFAPEVFGGQLRASADFFEFTILGEISTTALGSTVFTSVFGTSAPAITSTANCGATFAKFITWQDNTCVTGVTTAGQIQNILQYQLNTGGYITNGIDYQVDYTHDLGPGQLTLAASFSNVLKYKVKGYNVPDPVSGAQIPFASSFNGLGFSNFTRSGTVMPEWRGNASIRYAMGDHNFNLRMNYIQGIQDETAPTKVGAGPDGVVQTTCTNPATNCGTSDDLFATYGLAPHDYTDFDFNYLWTPSWMKDFELRFSVLNLTDRDPMPAQNGNAGGIGAGASNRSGYYNGFGNPRGRQINIGLTKRF